MSKCFSIWFDIIKRASSSPVIILRFAFVFLLIFLTILLPFLADRNAAVAQDLYEIGL